MTATLDSYNDAEQVQRIDPNAHPLTCPCREEVPCLNPPAPDGGVCDACREQGCDVEVGA